MHQLFRLVLGQKDLSRAGDLFSLDDSKIEDSLTEALEQIKIISSSSVSKLLYTLNPCSDLGYSHRIVYFPEKRSILARERGAVVYLVTKK